MGDICFALGTAVTSVVGTEGAGTLTKGAATSAKAGAATAKAGAKKAVIHMKNTDISRFLPYAQQYELAGVNVPFNVVDGRYLKDQLMMKAERKIGGSSNGTISTKPSSLVEKQVDLIWLGDNYKAVDIQGTGKVEGKKTDVSRRVYQRVDIDWDYTPKHPKAKGLSNTELIEKGRPPYIIDKNGKEVQIELHHLIQKEPGNMVEIVATTHDDYKKILHGLIKNGDSFRNDAKLDKQFNSFRRKYWKLRSNNLE